MEFYEKLPNSFFLAYPKLDEFRKKSQHVVCVWAEPMNRIIAKASYEYFYQLHKQKGGKGHRDFVHTYEPKRSENRGEVLVAESLHRLSCTERQRLLNTVWSAIILEEAVLHWRHQTLTWRRYSSTNFLSLSRLDLQRNSFLNSASSRADRYVCNGSEAFLFYAEFYWTSFEFRYIATLWHDDFISFNKIEEDKGNISPEAVVQLFVLYILFFPTDFHRENCG